MSELRQYHKYLKAFKIKQTQNSWTCMGDTPKDFAILQSEPTMQRKNVKVSLPKSSEITLQTPNKEKYWSLKEYQIM